MKKVSHRRSFRKFNFNLSNRLSYTLIAIFIFAIIGVGVYAVAGTTPNPGHSLSQLQPCSDGETLKMVGGEWTCAAGGGSSSTLTTPVTITGSANPRLYLTPTASGVSPRVMDVSGSDWRFYREGGPEGTKVLMTLSAAGDLSIGGSIQPNLLMKKTSATHNGNFGSYNAMNSWIQTNGCSGYHVCTSSEVANYVTTHSDNPLFGSAARYSSYTLTTLPLVGLGNVYLDDCAGWNSGAPDRLSHATGGSAPSTYTCDIPAFVACCK